MRDILNELRASEEEQEEKQELLQETGRSKNAPPPSLEDSIV
ncbi:hypothetical protein BRARA_G00632 [Brassica rapa]|nr:hypothetical protein BRARA_G00632 [Brassica rapa]